MRRVREIRESRRRRLAAEGWEPELDPWQGDEISHGPFHCGDHPQRGGAPWRVVERTDNVPHQVVMSLLPSVPASGGFGTGSDPGCQAESSGHQK
jgi:hypothetical protein